MPTNSTESQRLRLPHECDARSQADRDRRTSDGARSLGRPENGREGRRCGCQVRLGQPAGLRRRQVCRSPGDVRLQRPGADHPFNSTEHPGWWVFLHPGCLSAFLQPGGSAESRAIA